MKKLWIRFKNWIINLFRKKKIEQEPQIQIINEKKWQCYQEIPANSLFIPVNETTNIFKLYNIDIGKYRLSKNFQIVSFNYLDKDGMEHSNRESAVGRRFDTLIAPIEINVVFEPKLEQQDSKISVHSNNIFQFRFDIDFPKGSAFVYGEIDYKTGDITINVDEEDSKDYKILNFEWIGNIIEKRPNMNEDEEDYQC